MLPYTANYFCHSVLLQEISVGKLSMSDACKGKYYQLLNGSDQKKNIYIYIYIYIYIVNRQWHLGFYSKLCILTNNALKLEHLRLALAEWLTTGDRETLHFSISHGLSRLTITAS